MTFLTLGASFALDPESGQVTITGTLVKMSASEQNLNIKTSSGHIYLLKSSSSEVNETLQKLKDEDMIAGYGKIDNSSKTAQLESLHFIGLKRLLGKWWTSFGFVEVDSYSEMNFHSFLSSIKLNPTLPEEKSMKKSFQYSVSPSNTGAWIIFLSDEKNVYYTSMDIQDDHAEMKMYNPETGVLMRTIAFKKISH